MLKVTISGPCASGKTTLAFALEEFLRGRGFNDVEVDDVDLEGGHRIHGRTNEFNDMCLTSLAEKGDKVVVETVQTNRAGKAYISLDEAANR